MRRARIALHVLLAGVGVIVDRAKRTAVVLTTNLPFSEWTHMIPSARLCKALLDGITDQVHLLEAGSEFYRFNLE
jgi:DNA replication protein DnaC